MKKVGFQGISGAYSEMAAKKVFKDEELEIFGLHNFEDIFAGVHSGDLDFGVVPIENSLAGSIHKNIDNLNKYNLKIVGEVYLEINHCLLGLPGAKLSEIKEVYSHWQALAQCEDNIHKTLPEANVREYFDTAGAAKFVYDENDVSKACIASELAKDKYELEILIKGFQDSNNNYTRFIVIGKDFQN
jgi:chorismate mutase/prephenate dehydratase